MNDVDFIMGKAEELAKKYHLDSVGLGAVLCAMSDARPEIMGTFTEESRRKVWTNLEHHAEVYGITPRTSSEIKFAFFYMDTENLPRSGEALAYSLLKHSRQFRDMVDKLDLQPERIRDRLEKYLPGREKAAQ